MPPERANPTNIRVGRDQMGAEPDIQQATLNLLADMGVQAGVAEVGEGLTRPAPSTDTTPPTISLTSPAAASFSSSVVVEGEARDVGGLVAAVEYSLSSSPPSWHPANFTRVQGCTGEEQGCTGEEQGATWSLLLGAGAPGEGLESLGAKVPLGEVTLRVRAVDDSYNLGEEVLVTLTRTRQ